MSQATLTTDQLAAMASAIDAEFERGARMRKVVPAEVAMPGASYGVVVPSVPTPGQDHVLKIGDYTLEKPIVLSMEIQLEARHLDDLDNILMLTRAATRRIAKIEDRVIAYGGAPFAGNGVPTSIDGVRVRNLAPVTPGLFTRYTEPKDIPNANSTSNTTSVLDLVNGAIAQLQAPPDSTNLHFGPYACAFSLASWAKYIASRTEGGLEEVEALLGSTAIAPAPGQQWILSDGPRHDDAQLVVFSRETLACDLVRVAAPAGSIRGYAADGSLRYIIEDQFLLRIKDPTAFAPQFYETTGS